MTTTALDPMCFSSHVSWLRRRSGLRSRRITTAEKLAEATQEEDVGPAEYFLPNYHVANASTHAKSPNISRCVKWTATLQGERQISGYRRKPGASAQRQIKSAATR